MWPPFIVTSRPALCDLTDTLPTTRMTLGFAYSRLLTRTTASYTVRVTQARSSRHQFLRRDLHPPGHFFILVKEPYPSGLSVYPVRFPALAGTPLYHRQCGFRLPVNSAGIGVARHARRIQKGRHGGALKRRFFSLEGVGGRHASQEAVALASDHIGTVMEEVFADGSVQGEVVPVETHSEVRAEACGKLVEVA